MHQWRWRTLRDGAPLQRPLVTEIDRWVSICDWLADSGGYGEMMLVSQLISWRQCGINGVPVWVFFIVRKPRKRSNQQIQISKCLCTFFHTAASQRGHDAGLPPLSPWEWGHSSRPSGFCAPMKSNSLDVFLSTHRLIMLKPLSCPFSAHSPKKCSDFLFIYWFIFLGIISFKFTYPLLLMSQCLFNTGIPSLNNWIMNIW